MRVKGHDIGDAHGGQFFQGNGTVQGLSFRPLMLAALIHKRHDDIDPLCLACSGGNDPFEILEMIVRRHVIDMSVDRVRKAVVAYIGHDKQIRAADCLLQDSLCLTGAKTGTAAVHEIVAGFIVHIEGGGGFYFADRIFPEGYDVIIDLFPQLFTAFHGRQLEGGDGKRFF